MPDTVHLGSGKVRELYALGNDRLLLVASDRISTFDVVLPTEIPDKGRVLTGLAAFWFARTRSICPNHLLALRPDGRSTECRRLAMLPIECVVRGYLAGSGWKDYRTTGEVCGHRLPARARESDRLPEPIFTPATKAEAGHDENITREQAARLVGAETPRRRRAPLDRALPVRRAPRRRAAASSSPTRSSSSASTADGRLVLGDEALTPDSSRFWPADQYAPGRTPALLRQAVRARLLRADRLEQGLSRSRAAPRRRRGNARAVRRGLRAHHRGRLRRLSRPSGVGAVRPVRGERGAAVKVATWRGGSHFTLDEAPEPSPGPGQALVAVRAAGICGTDVHATQGLFPWTPPLVLGHEYSGVVQDVGRGVSRRLVGKAVACEPSYGCGRCAECAEGRDLAVSARHAGRRLRRARGPAGRRAPSPAPRARPRHGGAHGARRLLPVRARDVSDAAGRERARDRRRHHGAPHDGAREAARRPAPLAVRSHRGAARHGPPARRLRRHRSHARGPARARDGVDARARGRRGVRGRRQARAGHRGAFRSSGRGAWSSSSGSAPRAPRCRSTSGTCTSARCASTAPSAGARPSAAPCD